jgi:hypothetical protein
MIIAIPLAIFSSRIGRFWVILGFGLLTAYTIISYKTPWLIMDIIWPFFFVFGYGMEVIISNVMPVKTVDLAVDAAPKGRKVSKRKAAKPPASESGGKSTALGFLIPVMIFTIGYAAFKAVDLTFTKYADAKEKYVYVQTDITMNSFFKNINKLAKVKPETKNMRINVTLSQTYPLPSALSTWTSVNYTGVDSINTGADLILVDIQNVTNLEKFLTNKYYKVHARLRDAYNDIYIYYKYDLFKDTFDETSEDSIDGIFQTFAPAPVVESRQGAK